MCWFKTNILGMIWRKDLCQDTVRRIESQQPFWQNDRAGISNNGTWGYTAWKDLWSRIWQGKGLHKKTSPPSFLTVQTQKLNFSNRGSDLQDKLKWGEPSNREASQEFRHKVMRVQQGKKVAEIERKRVDLSKSYFEGRKTDRTWWLTRYGHE